MAWVSAVVDTMDGMDTECGAPRVEERRRAASCPMAAELEVSERGLRRRLGELGLTG